MTTRALRSRLLAFLYGEDAGAGIGRQVDELLAKHDSSSGPPSEPWSERDSWLITYADQFQRPGEAPLATLGWFFDRHFAPWLNGIHILPFYPWSSDDGFSVVDYLAVDPANGSWEDIEAIAKSARLGVDAVVNHMSSQSAWFEAYLSGDPRFAEYFRTRREGGDYSKVVRPRSLPLFTEFEASHGRVDVWTTFSADQVDLDFSNPRVLLATLDVLLTYARRGASFIRLDAIGFLWKEEGTTCIHLPQTHAVVQLLRASLQDTYPGTLLLTETNVPHEENISYFGTEGTPEAQMVYQFPLAPLVLDAYATGDASTLSEWAAGLELPVPGTTFFNFLASHDGVGVRPLEGIAKRGAVGRLADLTLRAGGRVSERTGPDGTAVPYELNSTWLDLVAAGHDLEVAVLRHVGSHAIQLALQGIPGIYVHSLFGSANDQQLLAETGRARSLNRSKFSDLSRLQEEMGRPGRTAAVFASVRRLVMRRAADPAFHPDSEQQILDLPPGLFGVRRIAGSGESTTVVVNLADRDQSVGLDGMTVRLEPFETRWGV
ncbi:MAG: sugar phosphorylase [Acidimicrobiia bacterium]